MSAIQLVSALKIPDRKELRRQIEMRERQLCRPGLSREERLTIGREYVEFRDLENLYV